MILQLAQMQGDVDRFARTLGGESQLQLVTQSQSLWAAGLLLVGILLLARTLRRAWRHDKLRYGAATRQLCRASSLTREDVRLARRLAKAADLPHLASLLISRGCFDYAAGRLAADDAEAERISALRRRVFEEAAAPRG
jgi:hypothetical protein